MEAFVLLVAKTSRAQSVEVIDGEKGQCSDHACALSDRFLYFRGCGERLQRRWRSW